MSRMRNEGGAMSSATMSALRRIAQVVLAAAGALAPFGAALAAYPDHAIQMIIPYPPGGSDALGRKIAATMSKNIGQEIVVLNVPGASTQVATRKVAEAAPDGYTLYVSSPFELATGPTFYKNLPFDPLKDLTPISFNAQLPYVLLVSGKLPVRSYAEFVEYAKKNPVRFGSYGALSQVDVIARRYRKAVGIDFQIIPYAGGSPAFNALLAGEIQAVFATPIPTRGFIKEGQMRPIAVTTASRSKLFPDVPTLKELGIDVVDQASYGLAGPKGLPRPIVDYLNRELVKAMNDPETKKYIEGLGGEVVGSSPEAFAKWLQDNTSMWRTLAPTLGLVPGQ
jgi:tripartite-type tricarboxylate transporter receptor subunit TctC